MRCEKCGTELEAGVIECPNCGQEIPLVPEYNVTEDPQFMAYLKNKGGYDSGEAAADDNEAGFYVKKTAHLVVALAVSVAIFGLIVVLVVAGDRNNKFFKPRIEVSDEYLLESVKDLAKKDYAAADEVYKVAFENTNDINYLWMRYKLAEDNTDKATMDEVLSQIDRIEPDNQVLVTKQIEECINNKDFDAFYKLFNSKKNLGCSALFQPYLIPSPSFSTVPDTVYVGFTVELSAADGLDIYYSTDGSDPRISGNKYYGPIPLAEGYTTITAAACNDDGVFSDLVSTMTFAEAY